MFDFFNSANQVWKITWLQFGGQLSKKKKSTNRGVLQRLYF